MHSILLGMLQQAPNGIPNFEAVCVRQQIVHVSILQPQPWTIFGGMVSHALLDALKIELAT